MNRYNKCEKSKKWHLVTYSSKPIKGCLYSKMQFQDDTYRAIELLRFLRRATNSTPWTKAELAIAIEVEDEDITSRLTPLYHLEEDKENNIEIRSTIREILKERKEQQKTIPSFEAVKRTLDELGRKGWVVAKRGKGCWLSNEGYKVLLLDILDAFGEDIGTSKCCKQRKHFDCHYHKVCRAYKFHKQLSSHLRKLLNGVTIEDIALGRWSIALNCSSRGHSKKKNKTK